MIIGYSSLRQIVNKIEQICLFYIVYKRYPLLPNMSFLNITYPVIPNSASDISGVAQDSAIPIKRGSVSSTIMFS